MNGRGSQPGVMITSSASIMSGDAPPDDAAHVTTILLRVTESGLKLLLTSITGATGGRAVQHVESGPPVGQFIVTAAHDYSRGVYGVDFKELRNGVAPAALPDPTVKNIRLVPPDAPQPWRNAKHYQNILRAEDVAVVTAGGVQYAIVADYNFIFNEIGYMDGELARKQVGGKIGIIQDPFGIKGEPKYLGATTPIVGAAIQRLSLSPDGKSLTADAWFYDEPTATGTLSRKGLLRRDNIPALIEYAKANADAGRINKPFDLNLTGIHPQQIVETGLPNGGTASIGWVNGVASRNTTNVEVDLPARYGDIFKVDLLSIIGNDLNGPLSGITAKEITGYSNIVESGQAKIVRTGDKILSRKPGDGYDPKTPMPGGTGNYSYTTRAVNETEKGDVSKTGILYIAPNLDINALRRGDRLADGYLTISFTVEARGKKYDYTANIKLQDFGSAADRVFFGDRDLRNPGYSKFELKGSVGVGQTNNALDVWRVEQRLKYLGYSAFGSDANGNPMVGGDAIIFRDNNGTYDGQLNIPKELTVDGKFGLEEQSALQAFYGITHYSTFQRSNITGTGTGNYGFQTTATSTAAKNAAPGASTADPNDDTNWEWLNAYNAPHWMNIGAEMQYQDGVAQASYTMAGWNNHQSGNTAENYGTSWMRDLMVAKQYGPAGLVQTVSWFNGGVDANHGYTPFEHSTHDLGMAFDLGISNYIDPDGAQTNYLEPLLASINALPTHGTWNAANALTNSALLPAIQSPARDRNDQVSALRDFLSLYAVTQSSSWAAMSAHVVNGTAARDGLFGSGAQADGLISKAIIGGVGSQNPYPNIHRVLDSLGIITDPNVVNHNSHFHIYLNPSAPIVLNNLLADNPSAMPDNASGSDAMQADAQSLLDYAQTLIEGEELMFIMDVPAIPAQQTPIVLAQAATPGAGATPQPDFILNTCKQTTSAGDPRSAFRAVDPAYMLKNYIQIRDRHMVELADIKNITLLEGTTHGKITTEVDNTGLTFYGYDPEPNYVGKDKAVFMAEFEGKRYKIVLQLNVFTSVNEKVPSTCPPPKLIKVTKPSSGASGYGPDYYNLASVSVTFADLPGSAVGQTVGNTITLDTNAAGHGWYVDANPWDNSEYLATSNPYEWAARAGSGAEGKMDLLSVLLHEYGHALGIEHSMDSHDYMATTLTPGVRRLPSAEELALMQRLVGQVKEGMVADSTLSPSPSPASGRGWPAGAGEGDNNAPNPALPLSSGFLAFLGRRKESGFGVQDAFSPQPPAIRPHTPWPPMPPSPASTAQQGGIHWAAWALQTMRQRSMKSPLPIPG